jgi:hypothetical protein
MSDALSFVEIDGQHVELLPGLQQRRGRQRQWWYRRCRAQLMSRGGTAG